MITVANIKTHRSDKRRAFRVDRSTPLGNPYVMRDQTAAERKRVCDAFELHDYLMDPKAASYFTEILEAAKRGDVVLLCWCAPKRCHAETIRNDLNAFIEAKIS